MSMDGKVDGEIERDADQNGGEKFRTVVDIVALYGSHMEPGDPQYAAIVDAVGSDAEARIVEWQRRAAEECSARPITPEKRRKLGRAGSRNAWPGSDVVTDLVAFRQSRTKPD